MLYSTHIPNRTKRAGTLEKNTNPCVKNSNVTRPVHVGNETSLPDDDDDDGFTREGDRLFQAYYY